MDNMLTVVEPALGSAQPQTAALSPDRILAAKPAYTTRFVSTAIAFNPSKWSVLDDAGHRPTSGDVVLARVERLGQHPRIELPDGRRAALFPGDEILVAYGNRYAPDQFEAELPGDLGPAHLAAAGGVAARVLSSHSLMSSPTEIRPVGLLCDADGVINLSRFSSYRPSSRADAPRGRRPLVIAVVGTSMNSGKTTTVAAIVRGLRAAGLRVAAGKVTGTGAGGDPQLFRDSGAESVLDFTDFGFPSTYLLDHDVIRDLFTSVLDALSGPRTDAVVLEIADGIYQRETRGLISGSVFAESIDHLVFAAGEAASAAGGCEALVRIGLRPTIVSGTITMSPLACKEAELITSIPVLSVSALADEQVAGHFSNLDTVGGDDGFAQCLAS